MISVILIFCFLVAATFSKMPYPWHASCKLTWKMSLSCEEFRSRILLKLSEWEGEENCGRTSARCPVLPCGQTCLYQFLSSSEKTITARHTTPAARYVDDLSFKMASNNPGCLVEAISKSQTWYAVLDYSTNYCNLRNLVDGAGVSDDGHFEEETSDEICTQYSMRDC